MQINRQINTSILQKSDKAVQINTKLLALVYCALAESLFSKMLHTPHGLELDEIDQIREATKANGIKSGWLKCAELAIRRVDGTKHNHRQNVLGKLSYLIKEFIYDPSLIRNKLAQGQWRVALNRENTAINEEITKSIMEHTVIELYRRKHALERLAAIVEDMIESPNRAHRRDYWIHLSELEEKQRDLAKWTLGKKTERLFAKRSYTQPTM